VGHGWWWRRSFQPSELSGRSRRIRQWFLRLLSFQLAEVFVRVADEFLKVLFGDYLRGGGFRDCGS
jgi:hypothetical protein